MNLPVLSYPTIFYFGMVNLLTFFIYGLDKYRAVHNQWRIPERVLLLLALIGGAFGAFLAMKYYHHKTKKTRFKLLIPFFCLLWGFLFFKRIA